MKLLIDFDENIIRNISMKHLDEISKKLVDLLISMKFHIATSESLTGGMISENITKIPGSSEIFSMGIVSYSPLAKEKLLGVNPKTIEKYNVVSLNVANEMVCGLKRLSQADICISTTGVAGPGTDGIKQVGDVCTGIYFFDNIYLKEFHFQNFGLFKRQQIRMATTYCALYSVYNLLKNNL